MTALVSILIPVYNRAHLIRETIQSALRQHYPNFEVIVVDNASTDDTWKILIELAQTEKRLQIFRNETNIGPVRNWIACVGKARGTLAKILWSDDLIDETYLEKAVPFFENGDVGFVYTAARIFSENTTEGVVNYVLGPTGIYPSQRYIESVLLGGDVPVSPGCAVFRTADLKRNLLCHVPNSIGSDFSQHAIGNDVLLFLLTAADYKSFAFVEQPLSFFRAHRDSISVSSSNAKLFLMYDVAKAYFVSLGKIEESLERKFNARLWIDRKRFNGNQFGIRSLNDFYPVYKVVNVDISYILKRAYAMLRRIMGS
ncbi:glycosyltransferase family 2 protein [Pandoraea apista]|uniref:glycosyltransferase family 2 protein n=1 Tax=Pandoraea apista TaxID=93218 RepID=UPI00248F0C6B|nr:glycosyltransferase family 2 protein [Pandoraea apista]